MINYYKILEIPDFSEMRAIKKAYRTLSKKYHPDVNSSQQAQQYFIVVKEAYEYLSDPKNKRYLDAILVRQNQIKNQAETFTPPHQTYRQPPSIQYFKANTSFYTLNDIVVIEWRVDGAKSVEIDYLGTVNHTGKHGLKLKRFEEALEVNMCVTGFDGQYYYRKLVFNYRDRNPAVEAWRQQRKINPNVRQEHFKKETAWGVFGRVPVETFRWRMLVALSYFVLFVWVMYWQKWTSIFYLVLIVYAFYIWVNISKRLHDINLSWSKAFLPNPLSGIQQLFFQQGVRTTNDYGPYRPPKYQNIREACQKLWTDFKKWSLSTKLAFSATLLSVLWTLGPYLQPVKQIEFQSVKLGIIAGEYLLVFDEETHVPIDAELFYELRQGIYTQMEVNQFMFTDEVITIELWTSGQEHYTVYLGFIGNHPVLFFILVFMLMLEWQLIQGYGRINNQEQLSSVMWGITVMLLMAWKLL
ncbi:MAG TPA: DnaJ domain-containing protein [Flavobacterium sp.]|nr:DnaJ domain-containing protein [Flavobacterium sp.]